METILPTTDIIRYVKRRNGDDARAIQHVWIRNAIPIFKNLPDNVIRYIFVEIMGYRDRDGCYIQPVNIPNIRIVPFDGKYILLGRYTKTRVPPVGYLIIKEIQIMWANMYDILEEVNDIGAICSDPFGEESQFIVSDTKEEYYGDTYISEFYNITYDSRGNKMVLYCPNATKLLYLLSEKTRKKHCLINVYNDMIDYPEDYSGILYRL